MSKRFPISISVQLFDQPTTKRAGPDSGLGLGVSQLFGFYLLYSTFVAQLSLSSHSK